jgi:formylglycine-generating enzyme required for sulfatase activity
VGGSSALEPTGARADCRTPEGVFDLSGNLAEMTEDAMKRGGSFRVNAVMYQSEYAQCDAQLRVFEGVHSDEVGFRCCRRP